MGNIYVVTTQYSFYPCFRRLNMCHSAYTPTTLKRYPCVPGIGCQGWSPRHSGALKLLDNGLPLGPTKTPPRPATRQPTTQNPNLSITKYKSSRIRSSQLCPFQSRTAITMLLMPCNVRMEHGDSVLQFFPIQYPRAHSRAPTEVESGASGSLIQLQLAARCRGTHPAEKARELEVGLQGGTSESVGRGVLQHLHRSLRPKQ